MSDGQEEIKVRLDNIHSIEPLLAALRTISLSNWKLVLRKINLLATYQEQLSNLYAQLAPSNGEKDQPATSERLILAALGSNRGLCSNFNRDIVNVLNGKLSAVHDGKVEIIVVGERLKKLLDRRKVPFQHYFPFPSSSDLTPTLLMNIFKDIFPDNKIEGMSLIYNQYKGAASYQTKIINLSKVDYFNSSTKNGNELKDFIFDTDPEKILSFLENQLFWLYLYSSFLSSAASEFSTRFQLMENASNNAERLSDELNIEVQTLRRQKITSEMRELAIGAGLLEKIDK